MKQNELLLLQDLDPVVLELLLDLLQDLDLVVPELPPELLQDLELVVPELLPELQLIMIANVMAAVVETKSCGARSDGSCHKLDVDPKGGATTKCALSQPKFSYVGCFMNNGIDRVSEHEDTELDITDCYKMAHGKGFRYFGLENPQGFETRGKAECLGLASMPSMKKTDDADCAAETDDTGNRL